MVNLKRIKTKTFYNQDKTGDFLTQRDITDMINEIVYLREENRRLQDTVDRSDFQGTDVEKADLIESMEVAVELDSLDSVRYALNHLYGYDKKLRVK